MVWINALKMLRCNAEANIKTERKRWQYLTGLYANRKSPGAALAVVRAFLHLVILRSCSRLEMPAGLCCGAVVGIPGSVVV